MLRTLILLLILVPVGIVFVTFIVTNRHEATVLFDPTLDVTDLTSAGPYGLYAALPLSVWLFLSLVAGVLLGGFAVLLSQGRYRREARAKRREADEWHRRADREHEIAERERERADLYAPQDATSDVQRRRRPLGALPAPSN